MKKLLKSVLIVSSITLLGLTSCKKEGCTDKDAVNYNSEATKDDGKCEYPADKFIGSYSISESITSTNCIDGNQTYTLSIVKESKNKIILNNLNNGYSAEATVSGASFTIIPKNNVYHINGEYYSDISGGNGTLSGSTIIFNVSANDYVYGNTCGNINWNATGTKL